MTHDNLNENLNFIKNNPNLECHLLARLLPIVDFGFNKLPKSYI